MIFLYYLKKKKIKHGKNSYQNFETRFPPLECFE